MALPNGFLLGSATSAYQVEGNNIHTDTWAIEQMKHSTFAEKSLSCCDHYHRYKEDIKLMKQAGLNAYRFSIEWARIEPEEGVFDETEIQHYVDVIHACHEYGIEPIVTLFHFSSPLWLIQKGGWENETTVFYFIRYIKKIFPYLQNKVNYVCTINEANIGVEIAAIAQKYSKNQKNTSSLQVGFDLEALKREMALRNQENEEVFHTSSPQVFLSQRTEKGNAIILQCHQQARSIIHSLNPNIKVGLTLSLHDIESEENDIAALEEWKMEFSQYLPYIKDDDYIGVQNYTRKIYQNGSEAELPMDTKRTAMGYEFYPDALEKVIRRVYQESQLPILVTENGVASSDDADRVLFIKAAMKGIQNCLKDSLPILGYLHWSFLDNFEWQKGFSIQFGLVSVNPMTKERTPKESLFQLGSYLKRE